MNKSVNKKIGEVFQTPNVTFYISMKFSPLPYSVI